MCNAVLPQQQVITPVPPSIPNAHTLPFLSFSPSLICLCLSSCLPLSSKFLFSHFSSLSCVYAWLDILIKHSWAKLVPKCNIIVLVTLISFVKASAVAGWHYTQSIQHWKLDPGHNVAWNMDNRFQLIPHQKQKGPSIQYGKDCKGRWY